jgi:hypothetical protein
MTDIKGNKGRRHWKTKGKIQNRFRETQKLQIVASSEREFGDIIDFHCIQTKHKILG